MPEIVLHSRNRGYAHMTAKQRRLMKDFIGWSAERLLGKKLAAEITIDVFLDGKLFEKERSYGYAIWEDRHYRGREFTMEIDSTFSFLNVLHTVAHEMVHIKQYALGELYLSTKNDDVYVHNKVNVDTKDVDYWEQPWEWEAHGRATGLIVIWMRERELNNETWAKQRVFLGP